MHDYKPYVVQAGDYLAKLAIEYGFDIMTVWNHPLNAELKAKRGSPDILYPGDVLYVPMAEPPGVDLFSYTRNRYIADVPLIDVEVRCLDRAGQPIRNQACDVVDVALGESSAAILHEGESDGDGFVRFQAPMNARDVDLRFAHGPVFQLAIGDMDPVDTRSGITKRLHNLGHLPDHRDVDDYMLVDALMNFQAKYGLPMTGEADEPTKTALVEAHGS